MNITEMIAQLEQIKKDHGEILVVCPMEEISPTFEVRIVERYENGQKTIDKRLEIEC